MSIPSNDFLSEAIEIDTASQFFLPRTTVDKYYNNGLLSRRSFELLVRGDSLRGFELEAYRGFNSENEVSDEVIFTRKEVYTAAIVNDIVQRLCPNFTIAADFRRTVVSTELDYFTSKYPEEEFELTFDFRKYLARDETIDTATWDIEVIQGTDPDVADMLSGSVEINGTKITETVSNGVGDVVYRMTGEITTDQNNTYVLKGDMRVLN